ncbi:MAG: hypothetical protein K5655_01830 [Lachnospiraceae bacterium]|nr:hypothetical protein [Lachnospiraceae bacterium]
MKNRALRSAGIVLMILSAGFICYRIVKFDFSSIKLDFTVSSVVLLLFALFIQTLSVFFLGVVFSRNVGKGRNGQKVPLKGAVLVYCRSNLGKYIPGNVFQYVERNIFFSSYGVRHVDTVLASLLEVGCLILSAFILSAVFGKFDIIKEVFARYSYIIPVFLVLVLLFIIVGIVFLRKKKKSLRSLVHRLRERGGIKLILFDIVSYTLILLIMGVVTLIAFFAVIAPGEFAPEPEGLLGAYIVAWLCGFVIVGAPGGIGVREAVFSLIYINTPYLDLVLALSILVRMISIAADVLAYIVIRVISGRISEKKV